MSQQPFVNFVDLTKHQRYTTYHGITIVLTTIVMLFLLSACTRKKHLMTDAVTNRDSIPVMVTRDVSTYISDSGVVRYKIITEEWQVFDRLDPSRWSFEKGIT